jgi:hypothetical protein
MRFGLSFRAHQAFDKTFDFSKQCCFCGADNTDGVAGYAGERTCSTCGKGGYGEPDEPRMAYKGESFSEKGNEAR